MKKNLTLTIIIVLGTINLFAQTDEYPHVTADNAMDQKYSIGIPLRFQMPMPLGLGVNGSFYIPNLIHVSAEVGYGWTYKYDKPDSEGKAFMPWVRAHAGWPFYIKSSSTTKFVSHYGDEKMYFYNIRVPSHIFIMPEAGIFMNPISKKLSGVNTVTAMAKSFSFGIALKTVVNVKAKVRDSESGKTVSGPLRRYGFIRAGIIVPMDDQIEISSGEILLKSDKGKFYINLSVPTRGGDSAWGLGIQSLGYDNQAALYFDWTFFIK